MTREEILSSAANIPFIWIKKTPFGTLVPADSALSAMQAYADQQTAELRAEIERLKAQVNQYNLIPNDLKKIKTTITDYSKDAPLKKLKNP